MSPAVKNGIKDLGGLFLDKVSSKIVPDDKQNPLWEKLDKIFTMAQMDFEEFAVEHFSKQSNDQLEKSLTNMIG
ncbi:MAG: hypothetical protein EKK55_15725 [Rhodocyclaceae bacterium]|nr:MAG: hypothetical protein EKK55_15725 [Rhodocyclaceae bacterium]